MLSCPFLRVEHNTGRIGTILHSKDAIRSTVLLVTVICAHEVMATNNKSSEFISLFLEEVLCVDLLTAGVHKHELDVKYNI